MPDDETIGRFLAIMDDPANRPVLVHCMHGVGRTGLLCALFRMEYDGWDAERAIQEAQDYAVGGSFYEGQDKSDYLRSYVPRSERPGAPAAGAAGARIGGHTD